MFLKHAGLQLKKGEYLCSHRQTIVMIPVSGRNVVFFGIYDLDGADVSPSIYYGLSALQHRGQESCGIAVSDTSGPKGHVKLLQRPWPCQRSFQRIRIRRAVRQYRHRPCPVLYHRFHYRRECTAARSELSERLPFPFAQRKSGQRYGTARADGKHRRNFSHFD